MSELLEKLAHLSPAKRELVLKKLQAQGLVPSTDDGRRGPPIVPVPREQPLPLSYAQQRLWFLDQWEPGSSFYNIPAAVRLRGSLDRAALERSLNEIVRRHEILRTTFTTVDGQAAQVVAPSLTLEVPVEDLSALPQAEREVQARRLATAEALRPFDLAQGPLVRASLLRIGAEDHVVLLTMHHIVSDGWSTGVLIRELATLYQAFAAGRPSPLSELPIQYADFAAWQREWLQGEVLEAQLRHWKERLGDRLPALELLTDRARPPVQTFRGATHAFTLDRDLTDALEALGQQERATLFMTLLAAFKTLLYRYTGQAHVVLGTPIANRNRREVEGLIGFFVNTLVLRTDLAGDPTFRELLGRVREVTLAAYAHQDLPFEKLVEELQPQRDMSRHPLFQVAFSLQNTPASAFELPDLTLDLLEIDRGTAKFDLTLNLVQVERGLDGALEYNTDLFEAETVRRMADHLQTLLKGIVADPDRRLGDLPLLTEVERQQLLVDWNDTRTDHIWEGCVHELFEAQAAQEPEALALVCGDRRITYQELNRRANQLAHYLQRLGVGSETRACLCLTRSPELIVATLATLKAGGAYVPLDPSYPPERLAFMLRDSGAAVLLTQESLLGRLSFENRKSAVDHPRVVCLDADGPIIARESAQNPVSGVTGDHLAYVIYTSGSTGVPKGVAITHKSVMNLVGWHRRAFEVTMADRATQVAGLSFDATVWELWPYLTAGASLHLPGEGTRAEPERLQEWLVAQGITISFLPTPLAEAVLSLAWPDEVPLRLLLTGGDKLHQYPDAALPFALVNNYGPTENTVVTTSGVVGVREGQEGAPSIGWPIDNVQVYLLDRHLNPVPVGVPGELCIGGAGLARGYLGRPGLTAEAFVPQPFTPPALRASRSAVERKEGGARLYRTGDLARYRPDGEIEFLGRIDQQVKLRGFRIELGEIEVALGGHPAIREAVVVAWGDAEASKRLVAYVVGGDEGAPTVNELRRFVGEKLPEYMVPSAFVTLDGLPLTPNGKVDRRALPPPEGGRPGLEQVYVAPRNPVEEALAEMWARLLDLEQVGVHDNFFELGGHSLLATQLASQVRETFEVELPVRFLFEAPTVSGLAESIGAIRWATQETRSPIKEANREEWEL